VRLYALRLGGRATAACLLALWCCYCCVALLNILHHQHPSLSSPPAYRLWYSYCLPALAAGWRTRDLLRRVSGVNLCCGGFARSRGLRGVVTQVAGSNAFVALVLS